VYPRLPGEWCQVSATLRLRSGDLPRAGRLLAEAGQRALAQGAAGSAVALLDQALELLTDAGDAQARADAFAALLYALVEAGMVERAVAAASEFEHLTSPLSRRSRAQLHTRLAWAAMVAGRSRDGLAEVAVARQLLGPDAPDHDIAPIDVVAAHLTLDLPGPDQVRMAEVLARRAAEVAEAAALPVVACQAWQLLGALSRSRDPDQATACLEQARQLAVRYELPIEEIHALIRLGNDDALRDGSLDRLEHVRREASRVGAVTTRYQAEASLALQAILRGDFAAAATLLDQVLECTIRLRLLETTRYALLLRAVLGAHQGRRRDMEAALVDLRRWEGDEAQHTPRVHGLARAWCALLEENRARALHEMSLALAAEDHSPTTFQLTGRYGLHLLLRVLEGTADRAEYQVITAAPVSRLRWDRQFALFASAVLSGRAGRGPEACAALAEAMQVAAPYATSRHLGLRLVGEAAMIDGWGTPVEWLRSAEEYFHIREVPAVASACRALMRRAGAPALQRRRGVQNIPWPLRGVGITVREYEILHLLIDRLSNREIAARLHLSPRTVEKHVASLIIKTGQRNRIGLSQFGGEMM
jgi:DNA-binding CsgD family transcriptional regulator